MVIRAQGSHGTSGSYCMAILQSLLLLASRRTRRYVAIAPWGRKNVSITVLKPSGSGKPDSLRGSVMPSRSNRISQGPLFFMMGENYIRPARLGNHGKFPNSTNFEQNPLTGRVPRKLANEKAQSDGIRILSR